MALVDSERKPLDGSPCDVESEPMDGAPVRDQIESRLEPLRTDGWQVDVDFESAEWVSFYVEHPLSTRSGFSLRVGGAVDQVLEQILDSREVAVIASAPRSIAHIKLLSEIRNAARAWDWPDSLAPQLAVALRAAEAISHEEMEWLAEAGAVTSVTPG